MNGSKIKVFTDLVAWQEGHKLVLILYRITQKFPKEETYSLTDQMRRCVTSITNNIAEGFSRRTKKEKMQYYYMSLGSVTELQNQLIISKDLNYISLDDYGLVKDRTVFIHKLINGLIKSSQNYT